MTNFEKIKGMDLDAMTDFLADVGSCANCSRNGASDGCVDVWNCKPYIREWLESETNSVFVVEVIL